MQVHSFQVSLSDEIEIWSDSDGGDEPISKTLLGCLTIEDIFEELIQEEIYDEYDFKKKPVGINFNKYFITGYVHRAAA